MKLSSAIILFGLYLIFTNSNANEKSKITNKLKNIDNIQFKFTQKINEIIEPINLSSIVFLSYFIKKIPFG